MFEEFIHTLNHKLKNPLPGETAQFFMAPQGRKGLPRALESTTAAVLILLYPVGNKPWIVFMKRPEYPGAHSGQVSLPGGKIEPSDNSLYETSLRETSEELGISITSLNFIGQLSPLHIPVSGFDVYPFIASCSQKPVWKPDTNEVDYLIEMPIESLLNPKIVEKETWNIHNLNIEVPFYKVENEKIWGATAMIISEFLAVIKN